MVLVVVIVVLNSYRMNQLRTVLSTVCMCILLAKTQNYIMVDLIDDCDVL